MPLFVIRFVILRLYNNAQAAFVLRGLVLMACYGEITDIDKRNVLAPKDIIIVALGTWIF